MLVVTQSFPQPLLLQDFAVAICCHPSVNYNSAMSTGQEQGIRRRGGGQEQSSQSDKPVHSSESINDSCDDKQSVSIERDVHASGSDEAINDQGQLAAVTPSTIEVTISETSVFDKIRAIIAVMIVAIVMTIRMITLAIAIVMTFPAIVLAKAISPRTLKISKIMDNLYEAFDNLHDSWMECVNEPTFDGRNPQPGICSICKQWDESIPFRWCTCCATQLGNYNETFHHYWCCPMYNPGQYNARMNLCEHFGNPEDALENSE